ncbi:MAG TPA: hypothetical protein PKC24_16470, partial [Cyclobacteriaceae bacterium]|nr:hypothetical protein [Cyclobacteriaceae bacterium]
VPVPNFDPDPNVYNDNDIILVPNLRAETFRVVVTSSEGCVTEKFYTVPSAPLIPQLLDNNIAINAAEFCNPVLENSARIEVQSIAHIDGNAELLADYRFRWASDPAFAGVIFDEEGNNGGELLDNSKTTPPNQGIVTAGSYWLRVEKIADNNNSGGTGCLSAPFRADINSNKVLPTIAMQSFGNTACDGNFEGSIRVNVNTASGPGIAANYDYTWTTASAAVPTDGTYTGDAGLDGDFTGLDDGVYTLNAINNLTGCERTANISILPISPPVFTLAASGTDQTICLPDGTIVVTNVFVDGTGDVISNFDYAWFNGSVSAGSEIEDPLNPGNPFRGDNLADLPAGTYFVKSIRNTDPGSGCESAAVRIDIFDRSVDPELSFNSLANTACNNDFDAS